MWWKAILKILAKEQAPKPDNIFIDIGCKTKEAVDELGVHVGCVITYPDLGVTNTKDHQLLITMIFLGLGFGQLIFGPLSDSYGRKPIIYLGFLVFAIASIICVNTNNYDVLIAGRILQGIGLASPRTLSIAMIRDSYEGDYMAKVMSFIVMIFILIPIVAPTLGWTFSAFRNYGLGYYLSI